MNFNLIIPEIIVLFFAFISLITSFFVKIENRKILTYFVSFGLFTAIPFLIMNINKSNFFLKEMYLVDGFSAFFKIIILLSTSLILLISVDYNSKYLPESFSEYNSLTVFAALGMMILVSSGDLITLFVSMELMAVSFIALTAFGFRKLKKVPEAALKYLLLNAVSLAILLYGLSLIYGFSGTVVFKEIAIYVKNSFVMEPLFVLGLIFVISGLSFKISAVPFHMWSPDVYDGAPTPVTAYLSVTSKAAGFAVLIRLLMTVFNKPELWMNVIILLAVFTVVLGNFVAIPQSNIKRLMAYSSIAQAGYILLGLIAYSNIGMEAALFYSMMYVFSNIGVFAVISVMGQCLGSDEIKEYSGLWKRSPIMAGTMLICLLSLAGIPPLAGFYGKFYLFTSIMESGYLWLVFVALGMSMVSVYYYLIVVKYMYFKDPIEDKKIQVSLMNKSIMFITVILTLYFGINPELLTKNKFRQVIL